MNGCTMLVCIKFQMFLKVPICIRGDKIKNLTRSKETLQSLLIRDDEGYDVLIDHTVVES